MATPADVRSNGDASSSGRDQLDNDGLPAAFWDTMPNNEENPDLLAIKALQEESTPEERAETLKVQGNELFTRGVQLNKKYFLQQALDKYGEAIALLQHTSNLQLKSTILGNRSQAQLRLGNNRHALKDAVQAMDLDNNNVKAAFRAATAASRLQEHSTAKDLCTRGLAVKPDDPDLKKLLAAVETKAKADKAARDAESARALAARAPARRLAAAMLKRGWRVGQPQVSLGDRKPYMDEAGLLHWPVVFLYPEAQQRDIVEAVCETDTLQEHLDLMFAPDAPPLPWDSDNAYTRDKLELYYLTHAATPLPLPQLTEALFSGWATAAVSQEGLQRYGEKASRAVRVDESATLQQLLAAPDCVVPGAPVFFVLAKGTRYRTDFLDKLS